MNRGGPVYSPCQGTLGVTDCQKRGELWRRAVTLRYPERGTENRKSNKGACEPKGHWGWNKRDSELNSTLYLPKTHGIGFRKLDNCCLQRTLLDLITCFDLELCTFDILETQTLTYIIILLGMAVRLFTFKVKPASYSRWWLYLSTAHGSDLFGSRTAVMHADIYLAGNTEALRRDRHLCVWIAISEMVSILAEDAWFLSPLSFPAMVYLSTRGDLRSLPEAMALLFTHMPAAADSAQRP